MDISLLASGTQVVLNDLLVERGLVEWQVMRNIRISTDSEDAVDLIYGNAVTSKLEDERVERKRKWKTTKLSHDKQQLTYCCIVILPVVSGSSTLSMKRLVELQQCADANEPNHVLRATKRTFLSITDAANISYYVLQTPATLP
ncbi:unnamed protein product [Peronospora belbahrii]|uniref:Uncharacterized protein n=1 Tax=Peronospora belbahrii TaxID=622444 RepID=A0AAU9KT51_9STRA|nr:unnamed protein product [Peronospora belbahrii]CAH0520017.1 unnamed protein product [Peronospora belbahrii]